MQSADRAFLHTVTSQEDTDSYMDTCPGSGSCWIQEALKRTSCHPRWSPCTQSLAAGWEGHETRSASRTGGKLPKTKMLIAIEVAEM